MAYGLTESAPTRNLFSMADENTNARIVLSRRTLGRYEHMPAGIVDGPGTLALIRDEVSLLRGIVAAHPEKALSVGDLVRRWEAFADRLKAKAH